MHELRSIIHMGMNGITKEMKKHKTMSTIISRNDKSLGDEFQNLLFNVTKLSLPNISYERKMNNIVILNVLVFIEPKTMKNMCVYEFCICLMKNVKSIGIDCGPSI